VTIPSNGAVITSVGLHRAQFVLCVTACSIEPRELSASVERFQLSTSP